MAEIATNVLHNVGNVLNSVYTAAQLAKERMTGMRLEHVSRVAGMLQQHQNDIGAFLSLERTTSGLVRIQVHDNGMGIAPEMLTRIFQYGFTTREEGHGFGLHSSALAAQELGGALTVHSEGLGRGATFTPEFPYLTAQQET